ncbi:MAG TPA: hypothetical protein VFQ61_10145, partial [Polyangiaceae bacterium]|nr:hypothetical protein [Polyangiaceae bacterium]
HPEPQKLLHLAVLESAKAPLDVPTSDHVFTLIGLATGQQNAELVRQGLRSPDQKLRGTALEYLESLLPEGVRVAIVTALEHNTVERAEHSRPEVARPETELCDELRRSLRGHEIPRRLEEDLDDT